MARKKTGKKVIGRSIYKMQIMGDECFMRPKDLQYGMDGRAWIWHRTQIWKAGTEPQSAVIKIKRRAKPFWTVTIPDYVTINAGDAEPETWIEIEIEESRTSVNQTSTVAIIDGFKGMKEAMSNLTEAFEGATRAIASGSRSMGGPARGKKKQVKEQVTDQTNGDVQMSLDIAALIQNTFDPKE